MPTMFISVTSVFLDEGDIGLGTIIGSTMFNILFITGTCGLATSVAVELKPYSIIRDALYYVMYLTVLLVTMYDGMIHWYEASFVTLLYGFYVVIMYYNSTLEHHFNAWAKTRIHQRRLPHGSPAKSPPNHPQSNQSIEKSPTVVASKSSDELPDSPSATFTSSMVGVEKVETVEVDDQLNMSDERSINSGTDSSLPHTKYDEEPVDSLSCPSERWARVRWTLMFPTRVLYYITIPDCRLEIWESWYIVTFVMSITWMGVHSYVLVWAVSVIGVTVRIPDCIMGLTLLAAGSSVPDAIASLVMTEQGMGDMALANAIGSNIFDMLCLSVPWLLSTTVIHPNSVVMIHGGNIVYVSLTLFGTVITTLVILYYNQWKLDKRLGWAMLFAYTFFLTTAVVIESFPRGNKVKHPLHRPDLPNKGLGVPEPRRGKTKVKPTGFTWI